MASDAKSLHEWTDLFAALAVTAGEAIVKIKTAGFDVREKPDHSPVSLADERAEAIILAGVTARDPAISVVAEELFASGSPCRAADRFILVDPLDGTREFLSGRSDYTVNIALIEGGAPVCGVVYAPERHRLWAGLCSADCHQAKSVYVAPGEKIPPQDLWTFIEARQRPDKNWICLASRSHPDPNVETLMANWPVGSRVETGSSLKFCMIAEGLADVYPRYASIMEWDTAAGDAVLRGAGGIVVDTEGRPLRYGKKDWRNSSFVAWGKSGSGPTSISR